MNLPPELKKLYDDIDFDSLRIRRPTKFLFFCGGAMSKDPKAAGSLRHYLFNEKRISKRLKASVVLAEAANQLYRDTAYGDLISFEEDIARISALILVIAESAGSLAELGAFASIDIIRNSLAVLIRTDHYEAESFVRYGPVERLRRENSLRVGVYPWRTRGNNSLIKATASPHVANIISFVNGIINSVPNENLFRIDEGFQQFAFILWSLHISTALSISDLTACVHLRDPNASQNDVKNKLFCMQLAGWVKSYTYENKTYWYNTHDADPFSRYSFKPNTAQGDKDTTRRKSDVTLALRKSLKIPRHVLEVATKDMKSP